MIEWIDASPTVDVPDAEYQRLLGYPPDAALSDRARELAEATRDWYAGHGRPWIYLRQAGSIPFTRPRFRNAGGFALAAVSAGPEIEIEAQRRWTEEKPDEYFFLETYGSAVVEHLITQVRARLCEWAGGQGLAVLPHDSPGYPSWDVAEQPRLLGVIGANRLPGELEAFDSGMLRPKKSQLAVFGLTDHTEGVARLTDLTPCRTCSLARCQFRRTVPPYSVKQKALARWAKERLSLQPSTGGATEAVFRYDGTTCTNMGRPLTFDYHVTLGPREQGFPILDQRCVAGGGHEFMCGYIKDAAGLMSAIEREKPLAGQPLHDVFTWRRDSSMAGCYCDAASRDHKWSLVFETIHYALRQKEDSA